MLKELFELREKLQPLVKQLKFHHASLAKLPGKRCERCSSQSYNRELAQRLAEAEKTLDKLFGM